MMRSPGGAHGALTNAPTSFGIAKFPSQLSVGDHGQHLVEVEWLEEKMECSLCSCIHDRGVGGAASGHHDNLDRRVTTLEQLEQAQAIAVRQSEIHESHGEIMSLHLCIGASGTRRRLDLVTA